MGMYTELVLKADIREDIPDQVRAILRFLFTEGDRGEAPTDLPDHPFFKADRWRWIGQSSSYYHIPWAVSRYEADRIFSRSDLKNYGGEIALFVDWLAPYVEMRGERKCIGWSWYEEDSEPTLLFVGGNT